MKKVEMFFQFAALGIRDEWCVFLFFAYLFVSLNFDNASVFALYCHVRFCSATLCHSQDSEVRLS